MLKINAKKLDTVEVLSLDGPIINGETESLYNCVQLSPNTSDFILDLSKVTVVDAHGLGVLLQLRERVLANGAHFQLINVSKRLYRIFQITRLNTVFAISSGVERFAYQHRLPVAA